MDRNPSRSSALGALCLSLIVLIVMWCLPTVTQVVTAEDTAGNAAPNKSPNVNRIDNFTKLEAALSGDQVVPAVSTDAKGTAVVLLDEINLKLQLYLTFTGIERYTITAIELRHAAEGANGPVLYKFATELVSFPRTSSCATDRSTCTTKTRSF